MEPLIVVLLVQVHAVWEHLFDISDLDRHVGRKVRTINVDTSRVDIIEAPDPEVALMEVELATSLEVQRLVLLRWDKRHTQEIWAANHVALKLNEKGSLRLDVVVDVLAGDTDFLLCLGVNEVPRTNHCMLRLLNTIGSVEGPDGVNIIELFAPVDNTRHRLLFLTEIEGVCRLTHANRVQE